MSEDENMTDEQREFLAKEKEKFRKESGKEPDVTIAIERKDVSEKQKLADSFLNKALEDLATEYTKRGKSFDPEKIKTAEDVEKAFQDVLDEPKELSPEEKQARLKEFGRNFYPSQESSEDRDIQTLKEATEGLDLSSFEFNSESEMKKLLDSIANDTNDSRHIEAQKLRARLLSSATQKTQTLEMESSLKDALHGKPKFKKKGKSED